MLRGTIIRMTSITCLLVLIINMALPSGQIWSESVKTKSEIQSNDDLALKEGSYDSYLNQYRDVKRPDQEAAIDVTQYNKSSEMMANVLDDYEGLPGKSVFTGEEGSIEWELKINEDGLYNVALVYFTLKGKSSDIEREFYVDDKLPFEESRTLIFPRSWENETKDFSRDTRGNDIRPRQVEVPLWSERVLQDAEGYQVEPYLFFLSKGTHRIKLVSTREPMVIHAIRFFQSPAIPTYGQVKAEYKLKDYQPTTDTMVKIQGEAASLKSSPTLYPTNDRSSPLTEPFNKSKIRMNTIGGQNWALPAQWIQWGFDAPEDGLYKIAFKSRQNIIRGAFSTRKLLIDGKVPFEEAAKLRFTFDSDWMMTTLGEKDEPYLFYFTKGKHDIRLEVSLGDLSTILKDIEESILSLNDMYRKILIVTGNPPDPYRDYQLERVIPQLLETLKKESQHIYKIAASLKEITGEVGGDEALLNTLAYQLKDLALRPETIQNRLDSLKTNIGALGTSILTLRTQPLEIDYLLVAAPDKKLPKAKASWFAKMGREISAFISSFSEDYNSIGEVSNKSNAVKVWIGAGRDQAQVLKKMIDDTFTPQTGIPINLELIQEGVILSATLAHQGPDVALQVGNALPVNFAMRNALVDVSRFPDYLKTAERFKDSAIVPYRYNEGVFALPETQTFNMLFYRKDILNELNLAIPQTWEDVYKIIPVLQKHQMQFAMPVDQGSNSVFTSMLYQYGGQYYRGAGEASALDSEVSANVFKKWSDFYTKYKLPIQYDFANRFRTGEMPIGIADYTTYNQLTIFAPELRGLWDFTSIPGITQPDQTIKRDEGGTGTAAVMFQAAGNKAAAWEFMKWWTSKETQVRYGIEMEALMGAAARYPTANIEALEELPWPVKDYKRLAQQWQSVIGIPEVPGGYFTSRHLDNAFRKVVNDEANPRDTLHDYVGYINEEINTKRKEFGLIP